MGFGIRLLYGGMLNFDAAEWTGVESSGPGDSGFQRVSLLKHADGRRLAIGSVLTSGRTEPTILAVLIESGADAGEALEQLAARLTLDGQLVKRLLDEAKRDSTPQPHDNDQRPETP